jgi:hypothetical protein
MKKRLPTGLICAVMATVVLYAHKADAAIIHFTIEGTYDETLMHAAGNNPIFSAGDTFNISGSYDTGQQPSVETKGNGTVTLQDQALFGFTIDYSSITTLTSDIPLAAINTDYPSADSGTVMGFNDDDTKNGRYFTDSSFSGFGSAQNLDIYSDYTHLFLQHNQGGLSGTLQFNYHETSTPSGPFTLYNWANDTIDLNVTSFITTVPIPSAILLFGTGLAGLVGTSIRRKKK